MCSHLRLKLDRDGKISIIDDSSSNGTFLKSAGIKKIPKRKWIQVEDEDVIGLGASKLRIVKV
jgi:hypothetical protein